MKGSLAKEIKTIEFEQEISGTRIGRICEITDQGKVYVDFEGNGLGPIVARFADSIRRKLGNIFEDGENNVLLLFENNDPKRPVIIDILRDSIDIATEKEPVAFQMDDSKNLFIDGKRFTFDAKEQIVLRCGKSSITLTRAGKILIKGAYLLNRSSGVNRIRGASVHIN